MNKIEKKLKKECDSLLPDDNFKKRVYSNIKSLFPNDAEKVKRKNITMASLTAVAVAVVIIVVTTVLVLIPKKSNGNNAINDIKMSSSTRNQFAFGAYSAGLLITGMGETGNASAVSDDYDYELELLGECLLMLESLNFNNTILTEGVSQNVLYKNMITVTQTNIDKSTHSFDIYYNEQSKLNDDDEIESKISGIIVIGETEYKIEGSREKELKSDSYEYEVSIKVYQDQNNYIEVNQEIERENGEEEISYSYSVFQNDSESYFIEISMETEIDEQTIEMKLVKNNVEIAATCSINYEKNFYNIDLKCENNENLLITVYCFEDRYKMVYDNGEKIIYKPNY